MQRGRSQKRTPDWLRPFVSHGGPDVGRDGEEEGEEEEDVEEEAAVAEGQPVRPMKRPRTVASAAEPPSASAAALKQEKNRPAPPYLEVAGKKVFKAGSLKAAVKAAGMGTPPVGAFKWDAEMQDRVFNAHLYF